MIIDRLADLNPIYQALLGTCFTWLVTALGAAMVFFFKTINRKVLDGMLGFAAGVMIAASFWSLLAPAIDMSEKHAIGSWFPPAVMSASSSCARAWRWGRTAPSRSRPPNPCNH